MNESSTVIGVFTENTLAEQAVKELLQGGFSDDEISVVRGGAGATTGGFVDSLKGLFSNQEATTVPSADDFTRLGVPEQDVKFYQKELETGRTIVLVRAGDLRQEALGILRRHGAYDAASRQS